MTRRALLLLLSALVIPACGSSPGESPHRKGFWSARTLYKTAREKKESGELRGAAKALEDFTQAADKLMTKIPPGDPYRDKTKELIEQAKTLRKELTAAQSKAAKSDVEVAAGKEPENASKFWGEAIASPEEKAAELDPEMVARRKREAEQKAEVERGKAAAKADMDARMREVRARTKVDEVDLEAEAKKAKERAEKQAAVDPMAKPKMPTDKITPETKPLRVLKVCRKGNAVVVYVLLTNKGKDPFRVGSVTGDLLDTDTNFVDRVSMSFEADSFEPDWKNLFDSKGTAITAESLEVQPNTSKMLAVICDNPQANRIRKVRLKIPTSTGEFFQGPD